LALVASAAVLAACNGGQPRIYKVAMDMSPLSPVRDASCYYNQAAPTNVTETTNLRAEQQWVVWDAVGDKGAPLQYLDCGEQKFTMGNSPALDFAGAIETEQPGTFVGTARSTRTFGNNLYTEVRNTTIDVTFNDQGPSPTGTMTLRSEYGCTPVEACPIAG